MPLSDVACRNAKPKGRPYKISDAGGLQLWVHTSGSRTWRMAYRHGGKQKALTLGTYPSMSLAEARIRRDEHKAVLRAGSDPVVVTPTAPEPSQEARTFGCAAKEWFGNAKDLWVKSHQDRVWSRIQKDVLPVLGARPIESIDGPEILSVIRTVEARGALDVSRRIRQSIGAVFAHAIAHGWVKHNPSADIVPAMKPKPKVRHFASLKERDLPEFFRKLEAYDGDERTRLAMLLTIQTMVRTNETRFARWSEFEGLDGDKPLWRIPAQRMKMQREHLIPLAPYTVTLLNRIRELSLGQAHLFPAPGKEGVMSQNTMIFAMYRMGYHSRATMHGFRRTASTILNEHGWNRDWIEKQLAHDEADEIRGAYNAAEYLEGRREMLRWWCEQLAVL